MQAARKGSDQTAHMRRLIWGFAGRTYHIFGNLMSRLNYSVLSVEAIDSVSSSINSLKVAGVIWYDKSQTIVKLIYFLAH